jgi:hypothetical protein
MAFASMYGAKCSLAERCKQLAFLAHVNAL